MRRLCLRFVPAAVLLSAAIAMTACEAVDDGDSENGDGPSRDERLGVIKAEIDALHARDREAWLSFFASDAVLEDPVGSPPYYKNAPPGLRIADFWDSCVAPFDFHYAATGDYVVGLRVARDVHTRIGLPRGSVLRVGTHALYELKYEEGVLKIGHVSVHYSPTVMGQLQAYGLDGYLDGVALSRELIAVKGLGGFGRFMASISRTIGAKGPAAVQAFADAINARDRMGLEALFMDDGASVYFPWGKPPLRPGELLSEDAAVDRIHVKDLRPSGWVTTARFAIDTADGMLEGLAFFRFDQDTRKIASAEFYWED